MVLKTHGEFSRSFYGRGCNNCFVAIKLGRVFFLLCVRIFVYQRKIQPKHAICLSSKHHSGERELFLFPSPPFQYPPPRPCLLFLFFYLVFLLLLIVFLLLILVFSFFCAFLFVTSSACYSALSSSFLFPVRLPLHP